MKIGIDIRTAGGEKAGKGWFTFNITRELLRIDTENEYILYSDSGIAGFEEFPNAKLKIIGKKGLCWHTAAAKDIKKIGIDIFFAPSSFIIPCLLPRPAERKAATPAAGMAEGTAGPAKSGPAKSATAKSATAKSAPAKPAPPKTIIVIHDLVAFLFPDTHQRKAAFIEKLCLKRAVKRAAAVTVVSENTKADVVEKFDLPANAVKIIHCAASDDFHPIEMLDEFREKTGLPQKFFLAVGTIEPRKNYETLIQAMAMIHARHPDHHLVIVGKKGWQYEQIDELIRQNYLQKFIHPLGYITTHTLNKLYNLAEALIFPSYYEGFGIPPLEAMKAGCPVISSHTSSMPEVIGDAGLFCDPTRPAEFAKEMERVISDADLRESLIKKGQAQSGKFSWRASAQKLYTLIKTL